MFTVADGAVIAMVSNVYLGRRAEASMGLRALRGRTGSLVGASILRNLLVMIGLILPIVPGLFMLAATFAVPMMIVVEGRSVSQSFAQSQRLVAANLWHVVRTLALLGVIVLGLFIIRTEGFDLEMMLEALGSEPTRTAAAATTLPTS